MVGFFATVMDDAGKIVPIGGIAALFLVMLKMVWSDSETRRRIETQLRMEFKRERDDEDARHVADLIRIQTEYQTSITSLKTVHAEELESLQRRIKRLRDEQEASREQR